MKDDSAMGYVFVSYSRWDRRAVPLVDMLLNDLRREDVQIWLAPDSIAPGTDFNQAIDHALEGASAMLIIWGTRAARARGMQAERSHASQHNMPIFLVSLVPEAEQYIPADLRVEGQFSLYNDYAGSLSALVEAFPREVKAARQTVPEVRRDRPTPVAKGYVFISYAYPDSDFVGKLRDFLKERGYGYWDYQDSDRNYHTQLFLELENVIRGAAATISVLSPAWKESKWAAKEYIFSEEVGTPVFLVMAREMGPTLVTAGIAYIDFTRDEPAGFAKLDRELRRKGLI